MFSDYTNALCDRVRELIARARADPLIATLCLDYVSARWPRSKTRHTPMI